MGNLWKEVAGLVADKVVDPGTKRPYSVSMVEKAMQEVHFNVRGDKSAKSQVSRRVFRSDSEEKEERGGDERTRRGEARAAVKSGERGRGARALQSNEKESSRQSGG